jgi:hypothetical protein
MKAKVQRVDFCGECYWFLVFGYFIAINVRKLNILNSLNILNFLKISDLSALVFKKSTYAFSGVLRDFCDFRGKQKSAQIRNNPCHLRSILFCHRCINDVYQKSTFVHWWPKTFMDFTTLFADSLRFKHKTQKLLLSAIMKCRVAYDPK